MSPTSAILQTLQAPPEQPRYADTVELSLADLLTTEAQGAHDAEQLEAVRVWLKEYN